MKKEEKGLIYNLLKTADTYECGYVRAKFNQPVEFSDDEEIAEVQNESMKTANADLQTSSEPQSSPATQSSAATGTPTAGDSPATDSPAPAQVQASAADDSLPKAGMSLEELTAKIMRCTRCQLARTRNNVVPGIGVKNPEVMVIGEGPGYDEDMKGEPFVGKAGILLDKMLNAIKLDRHTNCYIANIVKCRPPQNRDPLPEEQAACISFLEAQIHILKPKMILCMGRIAGQKLLNTQAPMAQIHGKPFDYNGIPLFVTYHPSALLRNEDLKRPAWEDLKAFRKKLDELV